MYIVCSNLPVYSDTLYGDVENTASLPSHTAHIRIVLSYPTITRMVSILCYSMHAHNV